MSPRAGSVASVWAVIDTLIDHLDELPGLEGVRVDVQQASSDDDPQEMISFGTVQDSSLSSEHLSGGQSRVARTEELAVTCEIRVRSGATMRKSAARAFELATYVEDYLAAGPRLDGSVAGLQHLLVTGVEGEPVESPRDAVYTVTLTLTGQSRLRGA